MHHTYVGPKKIIQMILFTKQREIHRQNKFRITEGESGGDKLGVLY